MHYDNQVSIDMLCAIGDLTIKLTNISFAICDAGGKSMASPELVAEYAAVDAEREAAIAARDKYHADCSAAFKEREAAYAARQQVA